MALSTASSCAIEEVAGAATGPLWFQLYHYGKELTQMLIERAEAADYCALCITVDVPAGTMGHHSFPFDRERRGGFRHKLGIEYANFTCEAAGLGLVSGTPDAMHRERPPLLASIRWAFPWLRHVIGQLFVPPFH